MSEPDDAKARSKRLSWLLRHGAIESGLAMDAAGWVTADEVRRVLGLSASELDEAVRDNDKQRLDRDGSRMRASQGHSRAGVPVTCDALEASWTLHTGDALVFHGTNVAALPGIAREGILPGERTHVHLASATDSTVGKRARVDVMLEVSPPKLRELGLALHVSPNGVVLARSVPVLAIVGLVPQVERARRDVAKLRGLFGFRVADA